MKSIICGAGDVGYSIADKLSKENFEVIVIDDSKEKLKKISKKIEDKNISIDEMIDLYEKGAKLALVCKKKIKEVESRMIALSDLMKDDK